VKPPSTQLQQIVPVRVESKEKVESKESVGVVESVDVEKVERVQSKEAKAASDELDELMKQMNMQTPSIAERKSEIVDVKSETFKPSLPSVSEDLKIPKSLKESCRTEKLAAVPTRKSTRVVKPREIFDNSLLAVVDLITDGVMQGDSNTELLCTLGVMYNDELPTTFREAIEGPDREHWRKAINEELACWKEYEVCEAADLPPDRKAIGYKWIFTIKRDVNGIPVRYKARCVAQGFSQIPGVDYTESESPTASLKAIRTVIAIATVKELRLRQYDFRTAYLNAVMKDEVYMRVPDGMSVKGNKVLRLKKGVYGTKQGAALWNKEITSFFVSLGFKACPTDPCIFIRNAGDEVCYIPLYVDDMLIACKTEAQELEIKEALEKRYKITDLGDASSFLSMQIVRKKGEHGEESFSLFEGHGEFGHYVFQGRWRYQISVVC
jgi:hypothetical protein